MKPIILAIVASLAWGLGTVLQKHGMATSFPKISLGQAFKQIGTIIKALFSNWIWLLGLLFMITGMLSFATALGAGDITLVQPLVCLTGVVTAIIGVLFLKEKVSHIEWIGIALILLGVVFVGAAGGEQTAQPPTNIAVAIFSVLTVILVIGSLALKKLNFRAEFTLAVAAGMTFGLANLMGKLMTQRSNIEVGEPFSFARLEVWGSVLTDYPILIVLVTNIFGAVFQQTAYANGRASIVGPLMVIISNVIPILAALTILSEQVHLLHGIGIVVVIIGTAILALKKEEEMVDVAPQMQAE